MATEPVLTAVRPERPRGNPLGEILLAGFLSTLLFAAFLALPIAGILALPFVAVPAVALTYRRGGAAGITSAVISSSLLLGLGLATEGAVEAASGAIFAAVLIVAPALFAARVRRGADASRALLGLWIAGFAFLAAVLALRPATGGRAMRQEIFSAFDQMAPAAIQTYGRGGMDAEAVARLKTTLSTARDFSANFWVGLVGGAWVLVAAIGFYTGARVSRPEPSAETARFDGLSVPAPIVALFVTAGAGSVLAPSPIRGIAGNVLLPLAALYFLAGLSIICHFARKWFRARLLRVGLYSLALYFPINVGVGLLGLFDWYADFRHRGGKA